jgi:uncharacterized membrane protein
MSDLIVIAYDTEEKGYEALYELDRLQKMQLITLEDAAVAVEDQKGKVKVNKHWRKWRPAVPPRGDISGVY